MAFTSDELAAIDRWAEYNGGVYDQSTNPYGLAGVGYRANPATGFVGNWQAGFTDIGIGMAAYLREIEAARDTALAISVNAANAVSTTNQTVGTGSKNFVVTTDIPTVAPFIVQSYVQIYSQADPTKQMLGQITAINAGTETLTINVTKALGSGSATDWKIITTGRPGDDPTLSLTALSAVTPALADTTLLNDASNSNAPAKVTLQTLFLQAHMMTELF